MSKSAMNLESEITFYKEKLYHLLDTKPINALEVLELSEHLDKLLLNYYCAVG